MNEADVVAPQRRDSARVVVLDNDGRVLLFEIESDDAAGRAKWITPGGGIEDGESPLEAARRELHEETGLECDVGDLLGPVAQTEGTWVFRGTAFESRYWFYALVTDGVEVRVDGWTELEREIHRGWRWWTVEDLDATDAVVFPFGLAELVRVLANGWHEEREPIELPWPAA